MLLLVSYSSFAMVPVNQVLWESARQIACLFEFHQVILLFSKKSQKVDYFELESPFSVHGDVSPSEE